MVVEIAEVKGSFTPLMSFRKIAITTNDVDAIKTFYL
jgi:hypothetical protein